MYAASIMLAGLHVTDGSVTETLLETAVSHLWTMFFRSQSAVEPVPLGKCTA